MILDGAERLGVLAHELRNRLTAAAQFIENFRHRKTLVKVMTEAYTLPTVPSPLHRWLATRRAPLIVDAWYDDTMRRALAASTHMSMRA